MTKDFYHSKPFIRIGFIALTLMGTIAGITYSVIVPPPDKKNLKNYTFEFPDTLPLSSWQLTSTQSLPGDGKTKAVGKRYEYDNNDQELSAEIRFHRYSSGNISRFLNIYTPVKAASLKLIAKHQEGIGYYALLKEGNQAILTACLNPIGESTITQQQFSKNRYKHGWGIKQTFMWLIGHGDLLDGRCFWTALFTPIAEDADDSIVQEKYQTLEAAWFDWYRWWKKQL